MLMFLKELQSSSECYTTYLSIYHQVIQLSEGMLLKLILFYLFISYLN